MRAALLLENGKYVSDYRYLPPFKIVVKEGEYTEFDQAVSLKEDIERVTDHKNIQLIPVVINKKLQRQLTAHTRLLKRLKEESEDEAFRIKRIDKLKKEIDELEKKLKEPNA